MLLFMFTCVAGMVAMVILNNKLPPNATTVEGTVVPTKAQIETPSAIQSH